MIVINNIRRWFCTVCSYGKALNDEEPSPSWCPSCGDGLSGERLDVYKVVKDFYQLSHTLEIPPPPRARGV